MPMTGKEFVLALRSVAAEEFTDAIKECEHNPHEFSSEFTLRMDTLLRRERRLSWRIMNSITSNVAAALLMLALLLTNAFAFPSAIQAPNDFEAALGGVYASAQIYDTAHAFIIKQGMSSFCKEDRSSSFKNVVYVNDEDTGLMQEYPYMDDEYDECTFNCHIEPYLCIEYSKNMGKQNIVY